MKKAIRYFRHFHYSIRVLHLNDPIFTIRSMYYYSQLTFRERRLPMWFQDRNERCIFHYCNRSVKKIHPNSAFSIPKKFFI